MAPALEQATTQHTLTGFQQPLLALLAPFQLGFIIIIISLVIRKSHSLHRTDGILFVPHSVRAFRGFGPESEAKSFACADAM